MPSINNQPPEGRSLVFSSLQIIEVFTTIQGEGPHSGLPAVFLRLAGCNLKCPHCDTQYTEGRQSLTISEVVTLVSDAAKKMRCKPILVITGGEPLRQGPALWNFIKALPKESFLKIQVETNGTMAWVHEIQEHIAPLMFSAIWAEQVDIVVSPKGGIDEWFAVVSTPIDPSGKSIVTWKYVLTAGEVSTEDGLPYRVLGRGSGVHRPIGYWKADQVYIQPADLKDEEANKRNLATCVESSLKYGYRLSVQVHKIAGLA